MTLAPLLLLDRRRGDHLRCGVVCARVARQPALADGGDSRWIGFHVAVGAPPLPARRVETSDRVPCRRASAQTPPTLLTEFVAAARAADSFDDALRSALSTLCDRLGVESAALLEKPWTMRIARGIAIGAFESIEWVVPVDGFLARRLAAYPMPLPFDRDELESLAEWAAANRPERLDEIRRLAQRDVRMACRCARDRDHGHPASRGRRDGDQFGAAESRSCAAAPTSSR